MADYSKVGLLAVREDGRVLLCRKGRGTSKLILPGGCVEPGENSAECLARELREELGEVTVRDLHYVGTYQDRAAHDDPAVAKTVRIELYQGRIEGVPVASSEIVELVWFGPESGLERLSPILRDKILPDLTARGILAWDVTKAASHGRLPAPVELLAPAKDPDCGRAAIEHGADAVYIGAAQFGARENAANTLEDVAALVDYAHQYWARTYVTVNTLLDDHELPQAVRLIEELYGLGIDGLILQDTGLLECDLPPLPLIASTQMHNHTPEKVAFLEQVGFQRAILARELSVEDIRAVRAAAPRIELECFVHGALCVGFSGQCYLSYAIGGRSGNRGQCAQPCRRIYTLVDAKGRVLMRDRHLLCLRDLNLSDHLHELLDAGVTAFKIEGRLKDRAYVANVTAYYRARLDAIFAEQPGTWRRSSSGTSKTEFAPDLNKTFNRGYTDYFIEGRAERVGAPDTPKMIGEYAGKVIGVRGSKVTMETLLELHPGDGLCFFDAEHKLRGTLVNAVEGNVIVPEKTEGLETGVELYRNHDHAFLKQLDRSRTERRIGVNLALSGTLSGLRLQAEDEDGNTAEFTLDGPFEPAAKPGQALDNLRRQLARTGDTIFACTNVALDLPQTPFIPVAAINALRRGTLERLTAARSAARPRETGGVMRNDAPYPEKQLSYPGNVLNRRAEQFYRRHGVEKIEPAAESGVDLRGQRVMTSRYCIKHQFGWCPRERSRERLAEPLFLIDEDGCRFELEFDCAACQMNVYFGAKR
jgi:putative protease